MKRLGPTQPLLPCGPFPFLSPAQTRSPVSFGPVPPRRPSPLLPPSASPLGPTARARSLQPRHARAFSRCQASPTSQRLLAPAPRARPLPRLAGELTPPARPIFPGHAASSRDPRRDLRRDPAEHASPRSLALPLTGTRGPLRPRLAVSAAAIPRSKCPALLHRTAFLLRHGPTTPPRPSLCRPSPELRLSTRSLVELDFPGLSPASARISTRDPAR